MIRVSVMCLVLLMAASDALAQEAVDPPIGLQPRDADKAPACAQGDSTCWARTWTKESRSGTGGGIRSYRRKDSDGGRTFDAIGREQFRATVR